MREVEEERPVFVGGDELHRFLGVARGERVLVGRRFDDFGVAEQWQRRAPPMSLE